MISLEICQNLDKWAETVGPPRASDGGPGADEHGTWPMAASFAFISIHSFIVYSLYMVTSSAKAAF